MKRTINERKGYQQGFFGVIILTLSLTIFVIGVRTENIIIGIIGMIGNFVGFMLGVAGAYGLGWEYKRMSLDDDVLDMEDGK